MDGRDRERCRRCCTMARDADVTSSKAMVSTGESPDTWMTEAAVFGCSVLSRETRTRVGLHACVDQLATKIPCRLGFQAQKRRDFRKGLFELLCM